MTTLVIFVAAFTVLTLALVGREPLMDWATEEWSNFLTKRDKLLTADHRGRERLLRKNPFLAEAMQEYQSMLLTRGIHA